MNKRNIKAEVITCFITFGIGAILFGSGLLIPDVFTTAKAVGFVFFSVGLLTLGIDIGILHEARR